MPKLTDTMMRAKNLLAAGAIAVVGALSIGCGPAPGYEHEARMPRGYVALQQEPISSENLAAQEQARLSAGGEVVVGGDADADEYTDTDPSALTEWKPVLEGHGTWVDDSTYGTVWVPAEAEVGADFEPYVTAGQWTYDDTTSWTWVSSYDWGWVPFHYGRWVHVSPRGWVWIPGRTYSGAWVSWRTGGPGYGYVGWAPMAPSWYWYQGVAVGWTYGWSPRYVYCAHDHVYGPGMGSHVVRGPAAREHDGRTADYRPASPGVGPQPGGGRVVASPGVGGRVVASPGVGGRVAASPGVGGRGPRPGELGISSDRVVPPPVDNRGLAQARALGVPRTAIAQGAAPPAGFARRSERPQPPSPAFGVAENRAPASASMIATPPAAVARPVPFNPRVDAVARAPQVTSEGVRVQPVPQPRPSTSFSTGSDVLPSHDDARVPERRPPSVFGSTPGHASAQPQPQPSYRSSSPSPTMAPTPSYRSPSSSSFSTAQPQPSFRSSSPSPSMAPTPSYRSSSPSVSSSPSFRSSPSVSSSPSYRSSSPSVSSSPSFRSSPSVSSSPSFRSSGSSSPRASSPSVRAASPSVRRR